MATTPFITRVVSSLGTISITFTYQSAANTLPIIDFFYSSPGTTTDGEAYLGGMPVGTATDDNGNISMTFWFACSAVEGVITATAQDVNGNNVFSNAVAFHSRIIRL